MNTENVQSGLFLLAVSDSSDSVIVTSEISTQLSALQYLSSAISPRSSLCVSRIGIIVWHKNKVQRGEMSCLRIYNRLFIGKAINRIYIFSVLFNILNISLLSYFYAFLTFSIIYSKLYTENWARGYIVHYQRFIINVFWITLLLKFIFLKYSKNLVLMYLGHSTMFIFTKLSS